MKRSIVLALGVILALVVSASTALAITYGQPDGDAHPYVGAVVLEDGPESFLCSGTLLSPTVLLTAGHCTVGTASAQVSFDPKISSDSSWITGTPYTHPDYSPYQLGTDRRDVGVVVLEKPAESETFGVLPKLGFLDELATQRGQQDQTFTVVGYGQQEVRPEETFLGERYKGTVSLINLQSALSDGYYMQYTNNPGLRTPGGTCFGDSGGPLLYDDPNSDDNLVVGITSRGVNLNCKGMELSYRTDIAHTQDFVKPFLQ